MTPRDSETPLEPVVASRVLIALVLTTISIIMPVPSGQPVIDAIAPVCSVAAIVIWLLLYRPLGRAVFIGVAFATIRLVIAVLPNVSLVSAATRSAQKFGPVPVIIVVAVLFALSVPAVMSALIRATRSHESSRQPNAERDDRN